MELSDFGKGMSALGVTAQLVLEVNNAKKRLGAQNVIDLSSGDPRVFPELANLWNKCAKEVVADNNFGNLLGQYGELLGNTRFIDAIINLFRPYGLELKRENILVSPGGLASLFYIINSFAGSYGERRLNILLPQCPEYSAYAYKGMDKSYFISLQPQILILEDHVFQYKLDCNHLKFENIGAVLLTRPSNPSGLILSNDELNFLKKETAAHNIPLIIDAVYSSPIPNLVFNKKIDCFFEDNVIYVMSFSKAGLAGGRLGFAIGNKDLLKPLRAFQINMCISTQLTSQLFAAVAIESGQLQSVLKNNVQPYYQNRFSLLKNLFKKYMGEHVPYYLHQADGGIFQWVWFKDLPISDQVLYEKLKLENVFLSPGNIFFFALQNNPWSHQNECIRLSLNESEEKTMLGIQRLAKVVNELY